MQKKVIRWVVVGGVATSLAVSPLLISCAPFGLILLGSSSALANSCTDQSQMINPGSISVANNEVTIDGVTLDGTQYAYAALIAKIGVARGFSKRDIAIAIATSYQESELYNLDYGDRDSLGLFQQRPSQGWGTETQILNPVYATNKFYDALAKVQNRERDMMEVAIDVQHPSRAAYEARWRWDVMATALANELAKEAPDSSVVNYTAGCQGDGSADVTPEGWQKPLHSSYTITSAFNLNRLNPVLGIYRAHLGVDLASGCGKPIYAAQAGRVLMAQTDGGHGKYVLLQHAGDVQTGYAHLSSYGPGIQKDVTVHSGQVIGYEGTTGNSTGCHLHFETKPGKSFVDPVGFMKKQGVNL